MKFEDFWEIYTTKKIIDNYEAVKETFSQELGGDILEHYEVSEVLTEFIDHYETAKEFEKIIEFRELLQNKNNKSFKEVFEYYDDFLVSYYCYRKEEKKVEDSMQYFFEYPLQGYELLLKNLKKLFYYRYTELGDKLIEKIYEDVVTSPDFFEGAEYELAIFKYYIELEKVYLNFTSGKEFNWDAFTEKMERFNFEIKEESFGIFEDVLTQERAEIEEDFSSLSYDDRRESMEKVQMNFMKYMLKHGMSFAVSGSIWNYLYEFWEEEEQEDFFRLKEKEFKLFAKMQSGFFVDFRCDAVLMLWGSSYVYDFLKSANFIESALYENSKEIITKLKGLLIKENLNVLWEYTFVHEWEKSEMVTEEELAKEKEIFKKYHDKKSGIKRDPKTEGFFIESEAEQKERLKHLFRPLKQETVVRDGPKIGRNERISVKYEDGTIKTDIKYKKVQKDIENGECEIIK